MKNRIGKTLDQSKERQVLGLGQHHITIGLTGMVPLLPLHNEKVMPVLVGMADTNLCRRNRAVAQMDLWSLATEPQQLALWLVMLPIGLLTVYTTVNGTLAFGTLFLPLLATGVTHLGVPKGPSPAAPSTIAPLDIVAACVLFV